MFAGEAVPADRKAHDAADALNRLGFKVLHIGATVSFEGTAELWKTTFNLDPSRAFSGENTGSRAPVERDWTSLEAPTLPELLVGMVESVSLVAPPELM
jgi:hypothetical protein